jgi:esterase/lipase/carbon monoxide dehydrogenase subunit G
MIDINEKFTVAAPPAEVYAVLSDPQAVVECVEGAALGETHDDGSIDGTMTVKFSAMRVVFKGRVKLDLEPEISRGTVHATGRDGQGGTKFSADATFDITPLDGGAASEVTATGAVNLTGKLASIIEGAANAVVRRMTADFVTALSRRCASGATTLGPAAVAPATSGPDELAPAPGPVAGVLLLHGFGSSPSSLRQWGEALSADGLAVSIPRLPGHGIRPRDLNRTTFDDWYAEANQALTALRAEHDEVFVMGISLGATLGLALAERRPAEVAGLVLVNPLVTSVAGTPGLLSLVSRVRRTAKPRAVNDVRRSGATDVGYDRIALRAALSLQRAGVGVVSGLAAVTQPVLLATSDQDHVVPASDAELIANKLPADSLRRVRYTNSYHVVPLDNDAPALFADSVEFTRAHGRVGVR